MIDKEKYIAHIDDPDQVMNMRKILDKVEKVISEHTVESTDFLDPYERRLAKSILNRFTDLGYREAGGLENAERKTIVLYPEYHYYMVEDSSLMALEIYDYVNVFSHRDVLGALMGLGIVREKIGDILVHEENIQIVTKEEIASYIFYNLGKIGKENIKIRKISLLELKDVNILFDKKTGTVASLRLDSVIGLALNLSRNDSQKLVNADRVKVNWEPINRVAMDLSEGDLVSVKGFGRFVLHSINGKSRKNRIIITIRILK